MSSATKKNGTPILRRRSLFHSMSRSSASTDSSNVSSVTSVDSSKGQHTFRIMMLGASKTGKSSIVRQFLYDQFCPLHCPTTDDMYRGEFESNSGQTVNFDIQDVGADYAYDFPPMWHLSVKSADAFIIVFSLNDAATWEEVYRLRDLVIDQKDPEVPIVIVANKSDMEYDPDLPYESLEATSIFDLENGYVECSAKERKNIKKIFKELLNQGKPRFDLCMPSSNGNGGEEASSAGQTNEGHYVLHRRQSLPSAPAGLPFQATNLPYKIDEEERSHESPEELKPRKPTQRRSSISGLRRDSCKVS